MVLRIWVIIVLSFQWSVSEVRVGNGLFMSRLFDPFRVVMILVVAFPGFHPGLFIFDRVAVGCVCLSAVGCICASAGETPAALCPLEYFFLRICEVRPPVATEGSHSRSRGLLYRKRCLNCSDRPWCFFIWV